MLDLVDDQDLNTAPLEEVDRFVDELFLAITVEVIRTTRPDDPLKEPSRAVALGGVDHDDRNVVPFAFHLRKVVRCEPAQVGRLAHPGNSTKQKVAPLAK